MTRITICAAKGSPGVTTLSCVLGAVWPSERSVIVAECDPSGGDLAGRFGLSTRLGMTSLILSERHGGTEPLAFRAHTQQLPGGLDVLVAPTGGDSAMTLDHELGMSISEVVSSDCDLLADCGRLISGAIGQEKMLRDADRVLLLVRPEVAPIAHARWAASRIGDLSSARIGAVLVGTGRYKSAEVADELDVKVHGVVPSDARAAAMASGATGTAKEFVKSSLVAFAREVVALLTDDDSSTSTLTPEKETAIRRGPGVESGSRVLARLSPLPRAPEPLRGRPEERSRATT